MVSNRMKEKYTEQSLSADLFFVLKPHSF